MALALVSASGGQVVQFPGQAADTATMLQNDRTKMANLGQQVGSMMQHYNDLWNQLHTSPDATKAQFVALFDERKKAILAIKTSFEATAATLRQKAQDAGVAIDIPMPPVTLQGLGQIVDTTGIQDQIALEQGKLTALQNYYTAYQAALAAGQQPPPVPAELQSGMFGMSGTTIAIGLAAVVGVFLLFKGK